MLDGHVSRTQCQIKIVGRNLILTDLGSAGGTMVNGRRIAESVELQDGDVIQIGQTKLQVESDMVEDESTLVLPAAARPDPTPAPDHSEPGELDHLVGTMLGDFHIKKVLCEDTYGTVFLTDFRGELQTIRVIWPQFAENSHEMLRFLDSFRSTRLDRHPNLVAEYGSGESGGYYWVSSEYVDGVSASRLIQQAGRGPTFDWRSGLGIALDIARGLSAAFEQGLIHRHLTPSAIFIANQDLVAKLADVVFQHAIQNTFAGRVVRSGKLVGEVDYMSPERTRGLEFVDTRSDIYSLGVVTYVLITGRQPFESSSLPDLIAKIRTAQPVRPSRYVESIPPALEETILRMIAKKPDCRFPNPTVLVGELEKLAAAI